MPDQSIAGALAVWRVVRFALVGIGATVLYALLALAFESRLAMSPVAASVLAYAVAAIFSYCGHKFVTFMSDGAHRQELPRFVLLTVTGFGVASALPYLFANLLGQPSWVPVLLTCVLIPMVNLIVLDRWVFRGRST